MLLIIAFFTLFFGGAVSIDMEKLRAANFYAINVTHKAMTNYGDMNYTTWPLQEGYVGLQISNLNQYVDLFQSCLVNIENHQGIDLIGITSPVFITRFDVEIIRCESWNIEKEVVFNTGRRKAQSLEDCHPKEQGNAVFPAYDYKLTMGRWSCYAHFELFHAELKDAPHFFISRSRKGNENMFLPYHNPYSDTNLGKP